MIMIYSELRLKRLLSQAIEKKKQMDPLSGYDFSRLSNEELLELIDGMEKNTISEDRINELLFRK